MSTAENNYYVAPGYEFYYNGSTCRPYGSIGHMIFILQKNIFQYFIAFVPGLVETGEQNERSFY